MVHPVVVFGNEHKMLKTFFIIFGTILLLPIILLAEELPSISCEIPLELSLLQEENLESKDIVTANSFSPNSMTIPSLWWAKEQFDNYGGRLVNNWLAFEQEKRIDLIVNPQLWNIMDYIERYRFVNDFGLYARQYNYNLRVFGQNKKCLAIYYYDAKNNPPKWKLDLTPSLNNSFEISK